MPALTGGEVVSQIVNRLVDGFKGEGITVYKDTPIQGAVKPYFYIQQLETEHTKELKSRGDRRYFMDVRLHPTDDNDTKQTWLNLMGERLFSILNYITISSQRVASTTMRFEIVDNVLHFFVEYGFKVTQLEDEGVKMRTLDTDEYINYYGTRR